MVAHHLLESGIYLKESCCCGVKPHGLVDAEDGVVGEESEEVEETGEVGASKTGKHQLSHIFSPVFNF